MRENQKEIHTRNNSEEKDLINANQARSSKEEHQVDALALGAEEGRDKLRKAMVRSTYPLTHRYPNGGTHQW